MASFKLFSCFFLVLSLFVLSSALDMSIITYNKEHGHQIERSDNEIDALYESWLVKNGKAYNALGEKEKRFEIFKDNLRFIDEHNAQNLPYKLGLNKFSDLTHEEYRSMFVRGRMDRKSRLMKASFSNRYSFKVGDDLPDSVDWREKGAVNPVKNQGQCGKFSWKDKDLIFSAFYAIMFHLLVQIHTF